MFGDLLGNFEEKQKEMHAKLATITAEAEAGNGAIKVVANGQGHIQNISIDKSKISLEDTEELEDLLIVALNRAIETAVEKGAAETQKMMQDMLPPGMGGLSGLFS